MDEHKPIEVKVPREVRPLIFGHGGARPNSGRKKGMVTKEKAMRNEAMRRYKVRVAQLTDSLLNKQLGLALGEQNLYVTKTVGTGDKQRKITEMVTDTEVVIKYLNGELKGKNEEYYYIATKTPDLKAIDTLLDRTYGKAIQHVEMDITDEREGVMPVSQQVLDNFKEYMLSTSKAPDSILEAEVVEKEGDITSYDIKQE